MPDDSPDDLVLVFTPPLVALLVTAEQAKGSELTEAEVLEVRDGGTCIALSASTAEAMAQQRGYDDLDPEQCWEQWQEILGTL